MDTCDECLRKFREDELKPSKYVPGKYCPDCLAGVNTAAELVEALYGVMNAESKDKPNMQGKG